MKHKIIFLFITMLLSGALKAQNITFKGKILDLDTHDPVPFASVSLKGTSNGVITDFEGNFALAVVPRTNDSLLISSIGYFVKKVALSKDSLGNYIENLNIFLSPSALQLHEVVIHGGENPAWKILRKVVENRQENNYKKLSGYQHRSYNKIEVDVNKISSKLEGRKIAKQIYKAADAMGQLTDDNDKKVLPMFISESVSDYYFRKNPRLSKENILKTNVQGVAVTDGSLTSQLIGSTFQQYNFYENQVNILDKNFTSPIGNDWKTAYDYYLSDSLWVGDDFCYAIEFEPKRKYDLVFTGEMWISKKNHTLVQIDATITKEANLNFIDKIKILQELEPVENVYFPVKNRVVVDVSEISKTSPGMLLKFTNYNQDFVVNKPKDVKFFDKSLVLANDYQNSDNAFWQAARPEPFSEKEQLAYNMIDTIKQVPAIKRITGLINIASSGYAPMFKKADIGPLVYSMAINDVEGLRLRYGLRTNVAFSRQWILQGYLAYGTKDQNFKGAGEITKIISRNQWTTLNLRYKHDLEQVGLRPEDIGLGSIYSATVRFGALRRPFYEEEIRVQLEREIAKGVMAKIGLRNRSFNPQFPFQYNYLPKNSTEEISFSRYRTSEILSEITFAKDAVTVLSDNERLNFGTIKSPTITLKYIAGLKNVFNSDFNYHHVSIHYKHSLNLGYWGKTYYRAEAGKVFGTVPFPLLKNHLGNETIFSFTTAYNLMNFFEFVSDQYASARLFHDFEGLMTNRIPLMKRLKWRTFATGSILYGRVSEKNKLLTNSTFETGSNSFSGLNPKIPYIELGYGINNIFRLFRVEAMHRLNYTNINDAKKFAVKITAELTL